MRGYGSAMSKKRTAANPPARLGALLPAILNSVRRDADAGLLRVWDVWPQAVGPDIAGNAQPSAFKGDLLLVHVANSVWRHHLQFLKPDMIERLNAALGEACIRDITFKIGPLPDDTAA